MKRWTRWQDWVVLIAGAYALLSPIWTETETNATWTMVVLGALLVVSALWSLAMPGAVGAEATHAGLGVLMVISPWVMGFSDRTALSWTAWIVGAVSIVMGLWALPESRTIHRREVVGP